jgi:hypothetical protein
LFSKTGVGRFECAICLLPDDLGPVMVAVRGGESDYMHLGATPYVCRRCVHGGVEHMVRQLRNRAESSRRQAQQFDRWADQGVEVSPELQAVVGSDQSLASLFGSDSPKA